jgi:hypothetical protein
MAKKVQGVTYNKAVKRGAEAIGMDTGFNLFDMSTAISIIYDRNKKNVADDLVKQRKKMLKKVM